MPQFKFQKEKMEDFIDEVLPLLSDHYDEIAHYKDIKLEPDFEKYKAIEKLGILRTFTARDEDNKIIGYAVFFVQCNIHYKSSLQAVQDILFITKGRRGFGMRFIKWCDKQLQEEGVELVYHHIKAAHNFGPLLERLGYSLVDLLFAKRLNKS